MRRLIAILLLLCAILSGCAEGKAETTEPTTLAPQFQNLTIGLITHNDLKDDPEGQLSWTAIREFCETYALPCRHYSNDEEVRLAVDKAITDGCGMLFYPSDMSAEDVAQLSKENPNVRFVVYQIEKSDMLMACDPSLYFEDGKLPQELPEYLNNVAFLLQNRYVTGYMTGYAAVCDGYHSIGISNIWAPDYLYGIVRGAQRAQEELKLQQVSVYSCSGSCFCELTYIEPVQALCAKGAEAIIAPHNEKACSAAKAKGVDFLIDEVMYEAKAAAIEFVLSQMAEGKSYFGEFTDFSREGKIFIGLTNRESADFGVPSAQWAYEKRTQEDYERVFAEMIESEESSLDYEAYLQRLNTYDGSIRYELVNIYH